MSGRPWIDRLVPGPPPEPHRHAREASAGAMAALAVETYAAARMDWGGARSVFSKTQRRARSFNSSKRRFLMDTLNFLVRHERTLAQLLEEAGLPESSGRAQVERARWLSSLIVFGGLRPEDVPWREARVDWDAVADPRHSLEGWFRRTSPSLDEQLGVFGSIPSWLAQRLVHAPEPESLVASINARGPICLRVNQPQSSREELLAEIDGSRPSKLASLGVVLTDHVDAHGLPALAEGRADIQDEGSQLIVELASPKPGERVIDACAGALGKSLAIASLQKDQGRIVATDIRKDALRRGLKRAQKAGYRSIRTSPIEAVRGPADLVLVDAPCTGTGALRRRPWTRWSTHGIALERFAQDQFDIVRRASRWVAPGGRLVYATCSLLSEENDDVVARFLRQESGWRFQPALELLGEERANQIGDSGVLRLYPHLHGTDGFYAAVLTRDP